MGAGSRFLGASLGAWLAGASRGQAAAIGFVIAFWQWLLAALCIVLVIALVASPSSGSNAASAMSAKADQAPLADMDGQADAAANVAPDGPAPQTEAHEAPPADPDWAAMDERELQQASKTLKAANKP